MNGKSASTLSRKEPVSHSEKTANMHYDMFDREEACTVGARQIEKLFRGSFDPVIFCQNRAIPSRIFIFKPQNSSKGNCKEAFYFQAPKFIERKL